MKLFLFSALMLLSAQASFAQKEIIVGDMNDDNELNIADVTSLVNTVIGKSDMRKISVGGSGSNNNLGNFTYDNSALVGRWYSYDKNGEKHTLTFNADGKYLRMDYKYQPELGRLLLSQEGKVTCYRPVLDLTPTTFTFYFPQNDSIAYYYRDFTANMASPDMKSPEGWSQSGNWSAIENGITEAYGGWDANTNNDYNTHQTVTLAKGTYKLTGYAFYRSGVSYDTDPGVSLAYMYAGDKKVKVMTLGSIQRSYYPDNISETHTAFYTDGDYKNVLYFTVDEDNTEVEIGFKGVHDPNTSKSWFICGALNLEYLHDHDYVDLDLPSGTLWATMNVGANSPEEFGKYYAWGEVTAYGEAPLLTADELEFIADGDLNINPNYMEQSTKEYYDWTHYKWGTNKDNILHYKGEQKQLSLEDDAAYVNWGENWRMPTHDEINEIYNNCTWTWTSINGNNGYKVSSKKDSSKYIFLPAAGFRNGSSLYYDGGYGDYWSSSLDESRPYDAWGLYFFSGDIYPDSRSERCLGRSVRAVRRQ